MVKGVRGWLFHAKNGDPLSNMWDEKHTLLLPNNSEKN